MMSFESTISSQRPRLRETKYDHTYFGHGKLLLSGEYFIMDGAKGIALPTLLGQTLNVKYTPSFDDAILTWRSYDSSGDLWFESRYDLWRFRCLDEKPNEAALLLQKILLEARKQNKHFLREESNVLVETDLEFPVDWGLGSSSSLIYNIAQWAYVSPFELLFKTFGGSGYDIACAQSEGPIFYQRNSSGPYWSPIVFNPPYRESLYFVYQGRKQNSRESIARYKKLNLEKNQIIQDLTQISQRMLESQTLVEFESLIADHEMIIADALGVEPIQTQFFNDYWGKVKSLGAWGGDFMLVTSNRSKEATEAYFTLQGMGPVISFSELILMRNENEHQNQDGNVTYH
ncbi:MAG: GHMP kinase [Bdellovibrio sp. CG12_big_fil_rev_8_21_14_0_65_39_13]|nr:MAG: GHMP kinase [Bdellovibrio sp. CG22_combo_CG10-13_8_21_14_all_39_27]PIQ59058.1 MAG: GHMP kinase [Bdellovibrio sp. CG12_big_fil_rev_8_21_14_0_65_39_13]PIR35006.1 MAG: GHMP kinase [Bdellovibrio sp. CG11_big_fil_rev_8_21_14_0_20_39_38]